MPIYAIAFATGSSYVALSVLELTMKYRLASIYHSVNNHSSEWEIYDRQGFIHLLWLRLHTHTPEHHISSVIVQYINLIIELCVSFLLKFLIKIYK